jgi:hypothetical protein
MAKWIGRSRKAAASQSPGLAVLLAANPGKGRRIALNPEGALRAHAIQIKI